MKQNALHIIYLLPSILTFLIWLICLVKKRQLSLWLTIGLYFLLAGPVKYLFQLIANILTQPLNQSADQLAFYTIALIAIAHFVLQTSPIEKGNINSLSDEIRKLFLKNEEPPIPQNSLSMNVPTDVLQARKVFIDRLSIIFGEPKYDSNNPKFLGVTKAQIAKFLEVSPSSVTRWLKDPELADSNPPKLNSYKGAIAKFDAKLAAISRYHLRYHNNRFKTSEFKYWVFIIFLLVASLLAALVFYQNKQISQLNSQNETTHSNLSDSDQKNEGIMLNSTNEVATIIKYHSIDITNRLSREAFGEVLQLKKKYNIGDSISYADQLGTAVKVMNFVNTYIRDCRKALQDSKISLNGRISLAELMNDQYPLDSLYRLTPEELIALTKRPDEIFLFESATWPVLQLIFSMPDNYIEFHRSVENYISAVQRTQGIKLLKAASTYFEEDEVPNNSLVFIK